jgi:trehalose-6-phosphate synthase
MDEDERARRSAAIRSQVREHDLAAWLAALLADVEDVSRNVRP